jgi:hypothetical protein
MRGRGRLVGLAGACATVAMLAGSDGAAAACPSASCGPPPNLNVWIAGSQNGKGLTSTPGVAPASYDFSFTNPATEPPVSFTVTDESPSTPVRVIAIDTLVCSTGVQTQVAHATAYAPGRATVTWQPNLACPAGQYPISSTLSAQGDAASGLTTGHVSFVWAWFE